jgi:peroxiredoxin
LPEGELLASDGAPIPVYRLLEQGPLALVFYRGAWCPFCSESLLALEEVKGRLGALGYTLAAVSPDRPALLAQQARDAGLTFPLLSDPHHGFAQLCGLEFAIAPDYVEQYRTLGTDLPARHGDEDWHLPIPGAFLIDGAGTVRFAYKNADPTERVEPAELLAAAEALAVQAADGKAG